MLNFWIKRYAEFEPIPNCPSNQYFKSNSIISIIKMDIQNFRMIIEPLRFSKLYLTITEITMPSLFLIGQF